VMEERLKGYIQAIGYKVHDEVCVKVDTDFKVIQAKTLADCRAWGKEFAEHLK